MIARLFAGAFLVALTAHAQDIVIYDDARQNGWQNWSWAPVDFGSPKVVHSGTASALVSPTAEGQALSFHHAPFDSTGYERLSFWIHGGPTGGQSLQVRATLGGKAQPARPIEPLPPNAWRQITVALSDLGVADQPNLDGFWIQTMAAPLAPFSVDDVVLVASPPPKRVEVKVDTRKVIGVIDERLEGINTAIWDPELGSKATAECLQAMETKALRFPGGSASDDYDWQTNRSVSKKKMWISNAATFARVAEARGAQAYLIVNYGSGTPEQAAAWVAYYNGDPASALALGDDAKGRDWKTAGFWATIRASAPLPLDDGYNFLRISHPQPFAFRYWEVGNENYGNWEMDLHGAEGSGLSGAPHDPETYAVEFGKFYTKMLAVDPAIRIGAVVATQTDAPVAAQTINPNEKAAMSRGWMHVVLARLKAVGVVPHFLIYHHYPQNPGGECDATLLQSPAAVAAKAESLRTAINEHFSPAESSGIELAMTELNSVSSDPGKQTASVVNALFFADCIGALAKTEFKACLWWDLWNGPIAKNNNSPLLHGSSDFGDYGVAFYNQSPPRGKGYSLYPTFYAAKMLAQWGRGGDQVLDAHSDSRLLSTYAARLTDGTLSLLVINKHPTAGLNAHVTLEGFTPKSATADVLHYGLENENGSDISSSIFRGAAGEFSYTFAPYSITVLKVR
ncbi:MAG: hypothetical protein QOD99_1803 [Chthoniobacter sp.]|jgi:hypothetical protein|nr:hypothetical protein [Chthoniobacter sp.]